MQIDYITRMARQEVSVKGSAVFFSFPRDLWFSPVLGFTEHVLEFIGHETADSASSLLAKHVSFCSQPLHCIGFINLLLSRRFDCSSGYTMQQSWRQHYLLRTGLRLSIEHDLHVSAWVDERSQLVELIRSWELYG